MTTTMRAKFTVQEVTSHAWGSKSAKLTAVTDDGIPENQAFSKATPWGELNIGIDNPAAAVMLQPGAEVYIDITPVVKEEKQAA